jgi:hypothetical protein
MFPPLPSYLKKHETKFMNSGGHMYGHCIAHVIWNERQQDFFRDVANLIERQRSEGHLLLSWFTSYSQKQQFLHSRF